PPARAPPGAAGYRVGVVMRIPRLASTLAAGLLAALPAGASALPAFTQGPTVLPAPGPAVTTLLTGVRTGGHPGYDRLVFTFTGRRPRVEVRYVPRVVQDGSGAPVRLEGRAFLQIVLRDTVAHVCSASRCRATSPRVLTPRLPRLRQVKRAGDFEAVVTYGAGLTGRTGVRVFALSGPSRVVVDLRR
ncbi:MAG: hypothetical protein AB1416_14260, partial [Actinomycetota bacterium]